MPQQNFRFLTVAARFPVHDEVNTNTRKPSRDRQEAEQLYWQGQCFCSEPMDPSDKPRDGGNPLRANPICVVLSASFCAKDLQILAMCQFQEILRAKRRAQDDVDRVRAKMCRTDSSLPLGSKYAQPGCKQTGLQIFLFVTEINSILLSFHLNYQLPCYYQTSHTFSFLMAIRSAGDPLSILSVPRFPQRPEQQFHY